MGAPLDTEPCKNISLKMPADDIQWLDQESAELRMNRSHLMRLLVANARRQGVSFLVHPPAVRRARKA